MLNAFDLSAAWLVACELFLDIEMAQPVIVDLHLFPPEIEQVGSLDHEGSLQCFPVLAQGRFRLAYDGNSNTLYLGLGRNDF